MLLNQNQIQELLDVIDTHTNVFIAQNIGSDYLTSAEIYNLAKIGIDATKLYDHRFDKLRQSFYFGLISDALKKDANKISYKELRNHFESGKHIPLTEVEEYAVKSIKKQFLGDLRSNRDRIFNDVNNIISNKEKDNRLAYEKVIRDEIEQGLIDAKTTGEVARELGHKTGDWSRNFHRIVEYQSHLAMSEGRIAAIERKNGKKVYMDVYNGACKHCIDLYLTGGIGSEPIIFELDQLKANGTNIGRKVNEWLATIPPIHPWCRCHVNEYIEGMIWDDKRKVFEFLKEPVIVNRQPIKFNVTINGKEKEYLV